MICLFYGKTAKSCEGIEEWFPSTPNLCERPVLSIMPSANGKTGIKLRIAETGGKVMGLPGGKGKLYKTAKWLMK